MLQIEWSRDDDLLASNARLHIVPEPQGGGCQGLWLRRSDTVIWYMYNRAFVLKWVFALWWTTHAQLMVADMASARSEGYGRRVWRWGKKWQRRQCPLFQSPEICYDTLEENFGGHFQRQYNLFCFDVFCFFFITTRHSKRDILRQMLANSAGNTVKAMRWKCTGPAWFSFGRETGWQQWMWILSILS